MTIEEALYPEHTTLPKAISSRVALRAAAAALERRGVRDVRICRLHWIVAPLGAAIIQATGRWETTAGRFEAFAISIYDGTEAKYGYRGGGVNFVIGRGTDAAGTEILYNSSKVGGPQFFRYQPSEDEISFEFVSRQQLEQLPRTCGSTLRADVERYLASLKTAWDAGDRPKVLSHFQHGQLLPPTASEYAMLGQLRFWDKPVKSVEERGDVIDFTVILDPEADLPAQFLALHLIRDANGELLMQSTATPERIAAAMETKKRTPEPRQDVTAAVKEVEGRKPVEKWPLYEVLMRLVAEKRGPLPEGTGFVPLAEAYRGHEAALLVCAFEMGNFRDCDAMLFAKEDGRWQPAERGGEDAAMALLRGAAQPVRRQPGLSLEQLPSFILYVMRDQPEKCRVAQDARDWKRFAVILDESMVAFALDNVREVVGTLQTSRDPVEKVAFSSREPQPDGRLLAQMEITGPEGVRKLKVFLAKTAGGGWIIDEPYQRKALVTIAAMRTLMTAVEAWSIDNADRYPDVKSVEELRAKLEPTYVHTMPTKDAWGTPFRYEATADRKGYLIVSAGADRTFKPERWSLPGTWVDDLTEDAVAKNGTIVLVWRTED